MHVLIMLSKANLKSNKKCTYAYVFCYNYEQMGVRDSFLGRLLANSETFSDEQVTQTINLLVEHGVKHAASDIHIEPHERFVLVRYRIDGVLKGVHKLPLSALKAVSQQVKTLADIHSKESPTPAEGQYRTLVGEDQFEIQVTTMPVVGGEKIVLHISRRLTTPPSLEALGFWGKSLHTLQQALSRTHGLIIVGTPRRSGKTTTMHSMLHLLHTPTSSIASIEDVIEYRVSGANQTLVRPHRGITFYEGLKGTLNQDPNIVLISSVADKHTAGLAVQSAAGGHLIIAGMHADHAAGALSHFQALSEEPYLFTSAVRIAISQRLVRKLCVHCREAYQPSKEEIAQIERAFDISSPSARKKVHKLEQDAAAAGLGGSGSLHTTPSGIVGLWRASDDGCEACHHSGYRGSIALVEVLDAETEKVHNTLLAGATAGTLRTSALGQGFIPMEGDALIKVLRGQTTVAEIIRTLGL